MKNDTEFVLNEKVMNAFLTLTSCDNSKQSKHIHNILTNIFPKHDISNNSNAYLVSDKIIKLLSNYAKKNGQTKIAKLLWKLPTVKKDSKDREYY